MAIAEPLTITASGDERTTRLTLTGEIDIETADAARERIAGALDAADHVELDLRGVTFIDSYGLRALVGLHGVVEPGRGAFSIVDASPQVRRSFTVTGLDLAYLWPSERR